MPKSFAEIKASPHVGLPERTVPICLAGKLAAEVARLDAELVKVVEEEDGKPRRLGATPESHALAKQIDELRAEMDEHTVPVLFRAGKSGDWRRWCQEHPAREDNERDMLYGVPVCNSDDLIEDLGRYVAKIGDEGPKDGDWAFVAESASAGDLYGAARTVMGIHESAVAAPKASRLALLRARTSDDDSE